MSVNFHRIRRRYFTEDSNLHLPDMSRLILESINSLWLPWLLCVSDRRPDPGGERAVVLGRDSRRGCEPAQVPQADDAYSPRRGQGPSLLHGVRRSAALGVSQSGVCSTGTVWVYSYARSLWVRLQNHNFLVATVEILKLVTNL